MDQLSLFDYRKSLTYNRNGQLEELPDCINWNLRPERCETCKYWQILPVEEQPPAGWTVKGQCNCSHSPEMMKNGYWKTGSTSYCQDYKELNA